MSTTTRILVGGGILAAIGALVSRRREIVEVVEEAVDQGRQVVVHGQELVGDWVTTLFGKTSAHEGNYWSVNANADGHGVSYGFIQWTQRKGGLGQLLTAMHAADPGQFAADFGPAYRELLSVVNAPSEGSRMAPAGGALLWDPVWIRRFWLAGGRYAPARRDPTYREGDVPGDPSSKIAESRSPANRRPQFQAVMRQMAAKSYLPAAIDIARMLGVSTERAMVLYYNRTVHQGVGGAPSCARDLVALWRDHPEMKPSNPNDVLAQYAWVCADRFRKTPDEIRADGLPEEMDFWHPASIFVDDKGHPTPYHGKNVEIVGKELKDISTGDYRTWPVDAAPGTLHKWDDGGMTNLYSLITWRSSGILLDPSLRDQPVDLAKIAVPDSFVRG